MLKPSDMLFQAEIATDTKQKRMVYPIIFLILFILISLGLAASFMIITTNHYMESQINTIKKEKLRQRMVLSKDRVISIIKFINIQKEQNQSLTEKELQTKIIGEFKNWYFSDNKNEYLFIYKLQDKKADAFATMLVNPNRPDLIGKRISKSVLDENGKSYRSEMLNKVLEYGEAYVEYAYKTKTTDAMTQKISYFKLYPDWNWIIATGVYIDDIENEYATDVSQIRTMTQDSTKIVVIIFSVLGAITLLVVFMSLSALKKNSLVQIEHFKSLSETLSKQVEEEVEARVKILKERETERALLIQQSKMAEMGSMISAIAHQWKQPLNMLSLVNQLLMDIVKGRNEEPINDKESMNILNRSTPRYAICRTQSMILKIFSNHPRGIKESFPYMKAF